MDPRTEPFVCRADKWSHFPPTLQMLLTLNQPRTPAAYAQGQIPEVYAATRCLRSYKLLIQAEHVFISTHLVKSVLQCRKSHSTVVRTLLCRVCRRLNPKPWYSSWISNSVPMDHNIFSVLFILTQFQFYCLHLRKKTAIFPHKDAFLHVYCTFMSVTLWYREARLLSQRFRFKHIELKSPIVSAAESFTLQQQCQTVIYLFFLAFLYRNLIGFDW